MSAMFASEKSSVLCNFEMIMSQFFSGSNVNFSDVFYLKALLSLSLNQILANLEKN